MSKLCMICGNNAEHAFTAEALGKYPFKAFSCEVCGFLQIDNPHWLDEAYGEAIVADDTGLVARNIALSKQLTPLLFHLFGTNGNYVDLAGGTGLFVRLMRDAGFDYYWSDAYCKNIHAKGFEFEFTNKQCQAATAFEVLEHLQDPVGFLEGVLENTKCQAFIFSTLCYAGSYPAPDDWWYYSFHSGQHISFFQVKTLEYIANRLKLEFAIRGSLYMFYLPGLKPKVDVFLHSRLTRKLVNYRFNKHLQSKTWSDSLLLREGR